MPRKNTRKTPGRIGSDNDFMDGAKNEFANHNPFSDYFNDFDLGDSFCNDLINDTSYVTSPNGYHSSTDFNLNGSDFFEQGVLEKSQQGNHFDDMYFNMKREVLPNNSAHFSDGLLNLSDVYTGAYGGASFINNNAGNVQGKEPDDSLQIPLNGNLNSIGDKFATPNNTSIQSEHCEENSTSNLEQLTAPVPYIEKVAAPVSYIEQLTAPGSYIEQLTAPGSYIEHLTGPVSYNGDNLTIPIVSDETSTVVPELGITFDGTNVCFNGLTKLNPPSPTLVVEPLQNALPKFVPKIVQNRTPHDTKEPMNCVTQKGPVKPRKKYERRAKPADGTDVRKPRKKYVRKNKTDKIDEDLPIVPPQQLQHNGVPERVSKPEHSLNFANMGIAANQSDLLILSPIRTRKFVSTRRSAPATSSTATVSNAANTDNPVHNDRVQSAPALSENNICDMNMNVNEKLGHLMCVKIPIIKERHRPERPNPNRRKQKLQIIPGAENFAFEILNRIESDSSCKSNEYHISIVDPYLEAALPEVEEIFARRKRESRKVYRSEVNIYDEDTLLSPPKKQHFQSTQPFKNKAQVVSPQKQQLDTHKRKSTNTAYPNKMRNSKPNETEVYQIQTTASPAPRRQFHKSQPIDLVKDFAARQSTSTFSEDSVSLSMMPLDPSNIRIIPLKSLDPDKDDSDSAPMELYSKSFLCQNCGNQFMSQSALTVHQIHCGVNEYKSQAKEKNNPNKERVSGIHRITIAAQIAGASQLSSTVAAEQQHQQPQVENIAKPTKRKLYSRCDY